MSDLYNYYALDDNQSNVLGHLDTSSNHHSSVDLIRKLEVAQELWDEMGSYAYVNYFDLYHIV